MKEILNKVPDKRIDKNTTSLKLKEDLINFFKDKNLENCVEIGTSMGYSTYILSHIFKNVVSIDIDMGNIQNAMKFNTDRNNITFLYGDSTASEWDEDIKFDVSFIDADHSYDAVISDIKKSILHGKQGMYIVFDDYGLPEDKPCVKVAVDEMIANGTLEFVQHVGEPAGSEPRIGRPLVDWEGIIAKVC